MTIALLIVACTAVLADAYITRLGLRVGLVEDNDVRAWLIDGLNDAADLNSVNANGVVFPTPALTLKEDPTNGKVMGVLSHGFDASVFSTDANGYFKVVPA